MNAAGLCTPDNEKHTRPEAAVEHKKKKKN